MTAMVDMKGRKCGRLKVLKRDGVNQHKCITWTVRCACGRRERRIPGDQLRTGRKKQCRVCTVEMFRALFVTHGKTGSSEYKTWKNIVQRCENSTLQQWADYGGRGIKLWPAWRKSFAAFFEYVGPRPSLAHTLDRIDNDGDYEPGNVRWATRAVQIRNSVRRSNELRDALCEAAVAANTRGNVTCEALSAVVKRAVVEKPLKGALVVLDFGDEDMRVAYFVNSSVERKDRCILRMFDAPFEFEQWVEMNEREELVALGDK